MQPKGFVDDGLEVRKSPDNFRECGWIAVVSESCIKLFLQL